MATRKAPRRPIIIDTDGGIDDAAALWWALTDPHVELVGVTAVEGVVSAAVAARNVRNVMRAAGRADIPIGLGGGGRLGPVPHLPSTDFIHGADGLGNTIDANDASDAAPACEATELLYRLCSERQGEVCVVSIGPLTNLARTIERFPDWSGTVGELIAMAGSARSGGNALPNAEFNVAADPVAAAMVVSASWQQPPLMIGLDVTHAATLTEQEFAVLGQRQTPAARYLDVPLRFYRRFGSTFTTPDCPCHDLLAVMVAADKNLLIEAPILPLAVDIAMGPAWASTIVDFRGPALRRVTGVDAEIPSGFFRWRIATHANVEAFRRQVRALFGAG